MPPVTLIFAKHAGLMNIRVRGEEFTRERIRECISQRAGRRVQVIVEEIFLGADPTKADCANIRWDREWQQQLREETQIFLGILGAIEKAVSQGSSFEGYPPPIVQDTIQELHRLRRYVREGGVQIPRHFLFRGMEEAIAENKRQKGSVLLRITDFDEGCQLATMEAKYLRNIGAQLAEEGHPTALEFIVKSAKVLVASVHRRDRIVQEQLEKMRGENPEDKIVVSLGINHQYVVDGLRWAMPVRISMPSDDPLTYYDEAIQKMLNGTADGQEVERLLRKDLVFNSWYMQALLRAGSEAYAEDVTREVRRKAERIFGME